MSFQLTNDQNTHRNSCSAHSKASRRMAAVKSEEEKMKKRLITSRNFARRRRTVVDNATREQEHKKVTTQKSKKCDSDSCTVDWFGGTATKTWHQVAPTTFFKHLQLTFRFVRKQS